jgi:hypothetical protein
MLAFDEQLHRLRLAVVSIGLPSVALPASWMPAVRSAATLPETSTTESDDSSSEDEQVGGGVELKVHTQTVVGASPWSQA